METDKQNTFIPHDVTQPVQNGRSQEGGLMSIVTLVSIVLLVASVALAAGVFLYERYLDTGAKSKLNQLKIAKAQFDPALIQEFSRLDDRMQDADTILGNHIAPSVFFHMLEANTLTTVSFRSLDFKASSEEGMVVQMKGVAKSVNSIALQADFFSKVGIITSPIFSNIDRQLDGAHFNFSAIVNPAAIRYAQLVMAAGNGNGSAAPTQNAPSAVPASAFPSQPVNQQQ